MKTNYQAGHGAEKRATEYLEEQGFRVMELNWSAQYYEIDIVAKKVKTVYSVEVKSAKTPLLVPG